jgi:hypothetical protein
MRNEELPMNINLNVNAGNDGFGHMVPPTLQGMIDQHREVMVHAGFELFGKPILIPEHDAYPGSYQVWWPIQHEDATMQWVFVGTDGVAVYKDFLPLAEDMV